MPDLVIDTNVLLVASAVHPYSPFSESHLPLDQQRIVFEWLSTFRSDSQSRIVLDDMWRIYSEYRNQLSEQDFGLQVIHQKLESSFRSVALEWDSDGNATVPESLKECDYSDRKFLAAALHDTATISIVNAADSDWIEIEADLAAAGVTVINLTEAWLRNSMRQ